MYNFIAWCNYNQGFLSFILSIMTIIISIIAINISNKIGKIPYKKKIKVVPLARSTESNPIFDIVIINNGYLEIGITQVTITDNMNLFLGGYSGNPIFIGQGRIKKCRIEIRDGQDYINDNIIDINNKIIIRVYDVSDKEYIFKNGFPVG